MSGDEIVYVTQAAAENVAVLHDRRPDGDYGDPASDDVTDFRGLHVWTGPAGPTDWAEPIRPVGEDRWGLVFEVPLAEGATALSYIIHCGDAKDLRRTSHST